MLSENERAAINVPGAAAKEPLPWKARGAIGANISDLGPKASRACLGASALCLSALYLSTHHLCTYHLDKTSLFLLLRLTPSIEVPLAPNGPLGFQVKPCVFHHFVALFSCLTFSHNFWIWVPFWDPSWMISRSLGKKDPSKDST